MSDKLMLSAVLSVLMMATYVLLGAETARTPSAYVPSAYAGAEPVYTTVLRLPSLGLVLARARTRHILY